MQRNAALFSFLDLIYRPAGSPVRAGAASRLHSRLVLVPPVYRITGVRHILRIPQQLSEVVLLC